VKVMKQGGLLRCLQAVETAAGAGIRCVLGHGFGLTISTLAELHVAATSDDVLDGVECVGPTKLAGDVVSEPLRLEAGMVAVPSAPGLGALLDEAALGRYRVAAGS
jgi:muconate cycloisomerase